MSRVCAHPFLLDRREEWAVIGRKWIAELPQKPGSGGKIIHYWAKTSSVHPSIFVNAWFRISMGKGRPPRGAAQGPGPPSSLWLRVQPAQGVRESRGNVGGFMRRCAAPLRGIDPEGGHPLPPRYPPKMKWCPGECQVDLQPARDEAEKRGP